MRNFLAFAALTLLTACVFTGPFHPYHDGCEAGWSGSDASCTRNYQQPVVTVISIGPSRVYADSADSLCYQLSPTPASIRQGDSYRFQNNTGFNVTIVGSDGIPWITVAAWSTSPTLASSAPGVYGFGIQGCTGVAGTAWYGILDVTVN